MPPPPPPVEVIDEKVESLPEEPLDAPPPPTVTVYGVPPETDKPLADL
jgi:hypothetical protein